MKTKLYVLALLGLIGLGTLAMGGCGKDTEKFTMRAEITELGEGELLVRVIEAPHGNEGPFFVLISPDTEICAADGGRLSSSDLSVGDTVEITYGGQVMMSYPPKIAAIKVAVI